MKSMIYITCTKRQGWWCRCRWWNAWDICVWSLVVEDC